MARFPGYGPQAYQDKNKNKPVEDLTATINGREGTKTEDPSQLEVHKNLSKAARAKQARYNGED